MYAGRRSGVAARGLALFRRARQPKLQSLRFAVCFWDTALEGYATEFAASRCVFANSLAGCATEVLRFAVCFGTQPWSAMPQDFSLRGLFLETAWRAVPQGLRFTDCLEHRLAGCATKFEHSFWKAMLQGLALRGIIGTQPWKAMLRGVGASRGGPDRKVMDATRSRFARTGRRPCDGSHSSTLPLSDSFTLLLFHSPAALLSR